MSSIVTDPEYVILMPVHTGDSEDSSSSVTSVISRGVGSYFDLVQPKCANKYKVQLFECCSGASFNN